jgi:hypothetical protein
LPAPVRVAALQQGSGFSGYPPEASEDFVSGNIQTDLSRRLVPAQVLEGGSGWR